ncbi:MAG: methyltransferase domain-containing protein [Candidatus Zambryskibacteria bacterium]|nr:methyltransferase domain-containing protein [Candidatus Zambryskibacteria bacterium]
MFQKITRRNLEKFLKNHASDKRVLDIGSGGSGYDKFFPNRIAVDIDPNRKPDIVADAKKLPFRDEEFEMILCTEVLEHIDEPKVAINEMKRVLKKGGKLILTTRFIYPMHDIPHDYFRFTLFGMKKLFEDWEIIELKPETETFSAIGVLIQRIVFQTSLHLNKISKLLLLFLAWIFNHANFLIIEEYGNIKKTIKIDGSIINTGYYLFAKKK